MSDTKKSTRHANGRDDEQYKKNSLSLVGAVSMGTGVMIGAGIFALTGQVAEQAGGLFPLAFLAGAVVTAFSAYSYIKMSNAHPSAGGIAMYLQMAYGKGNVSRAIIISLLICVVVYFLVALAIAGNLSLGEIVGARDFVLAEAARPAFGDWGLWFTVALAMVATVSGVIASVFAVSRVLAMLTEMGLVPHRHFGMPGNIQTHTLVYTIVIAMVLVTPARPSL